MVGLSIVLEDSNPQVINKTTMLINKPSSPSFSSSSNPSLKNLSKSTFLSPTFLNECFLCKRRLLPGNDIYMYRGDRAFCSVECRCRQILMDEEESIRKDNFCSDSSSSASRQHQQGKGKGKGNKNRKGRFVC